MRILFCDDDPTITNLLQKYVTEFFKERSLELPEYVTYNSGDQIIQESPKVDIAFLDVEMPGVSGIHAGVKLKEQNQSVKILIVTSYPDYLDEAMRFQVFRYLSKPIDKNRLFRNLKDAIFQYNTESKEYIIVTSDGMYTRKAEEIVCIQASARKTIVYTTTGTLTSVEKMQNWKEQLTLPCFQEIHRSYIINMRFVYSITDDEVCLRYGEHEVYAYLARRKCPHFKEQYLQFMEGTK